MASHSVLYVAARARLHTRGAGCAKPGKSPSIGDPPLFVWFIITLIGGLARIDDLHHVAVYIDHDAETHQA